MRLSAEQKKLLVDKYKKIVKPLVIQAIRDTPVLDLVVDNVEKDAKLAGIKFSLR